MVIIQDEAVKKEENKDVPGQAAASALDKAQELKNITPNWKKKLAGTLLAIALPVMSLTFQGADTLHSINTGEINDSPDLPDVNIEQRLYEQIPESGIKVPTLGERFYPEFAHVLSPESNQTIDDVFKFELAKSLFPEIKLSPTSLQDPTVSSKIDNGIDKYKQENPSFYTGLYDKFVNGVKRMNPQVQIDPGKSLGGEINSLSMTPIIADMQLTKLIGREV